MFLRRGILRIANVGDTQLDPLELKEKIMKIKETVERECCNDNDLKPYKGRSEDIQEKEKTMFCQYCGQVWVCTRQMNPAGSMDPCRVPVILRTDKVESCITL